MAKLVLEYDVEDLCCELPKNVWGRLLMDIEELDDVSGVGVHRGREIITVDVEADSRLLERSEMVDAEVERKLEGYRACLKAGHYKVDSPSPTEVFRAMRDRLALIGRSNTDIDRVAIGKLVASANELIAGGRY